nr:HrpJ domain-containing protein [Lonsdalea britannica]
MLQTPPASVEALIQAAGGDAARGDIVLRHVLAQAREQRDPGLEQAARDNLERLHQEKGPEVRAGLNTAAAISLFSTDPQQKQILRELYYERIVHQQSPSSLLDACWNALTPSTSQPVCAPCNGRSPTTSPHWPPPFRRPR